MWGGGRVARARQRGDIDPVPRHPVGAPGRRVMGARVRLMPVRDSDVFSASRRGRGLARPR